MFLKEWHARRNLRKSLEPISLTRKTLRQRARTAAKRSIAVYISGAGALLYIIGSTTWVQGVEYFGIRWDEFCSHLGAIVFFGFLFQWLFELASKEHIIEDVADRLIGSYEVRTSGIAGFTNDSSKIDYSDQILQSDDLVIGLHYSPRLLKDNLDRLKLRAVKSRRTIIAIIDDQSEAFKYLLSLRPDPDEVHSKLRATREIADQIAAAAPDNVKIVHHRHVLRYSFVLSDSGIWMKCYTNNESGGSGAGIPAYFIRAETPLFEFYKKDVEKLLNTRKVLIEYGGA